ncbi:MAG: TerB family tellurite resistance protein [Polyangiaceae bacterium]|nr:TerB family tellurite resistance protein [Polyangiaceae bacterium]
MLKSLVSVAWADGHFADEESEILEAMISLFRVDAEGAELMRAFARTPRTVDDVPFADLGPDDRALLVRHAVILSYIDGEQDDEEREVIAEIVKRLEIPESEAATLILAADTEARELLGLSSGEGGA